MEYLQRLLDKIDRFELLIAGLVGAVIASRWHKDDLANWRTWVIFLITGGASSLHLAGMVSAYRSSFKPLLCQNQAADSQAHCGCSSNSGCRSKRSSPNSASLQAR